MWFSKRRRVFRLPEGEGGRGEVKEREGGGERGKKGGREGGEEGRQVPSSLSQYDIHEVIDDHAV